MWFVNTGYLIALFSPNDTHHAKALALQAQVQRERRPLLTTEAVVFEVGAAFSRVAYRAQAAYSAVRAANTTFPHHVLPKKIYASPPKCSMTLGLPVGDH